MLTRTAPTATIREQTITHAYAKGNLPQIERCELLEGLRESGHVHIKVRVVRQSTAAAMLTPC